MQAAGGRALLGAASSENCVRVKCIIEAVLRVVTEVTYGSASSTTALNVLRVRPRRGSGRIFSTAIRIKAFSFLMFSFAFLHQTCGEAEK